MAAKAMRVALALLGNAATQHSKERGRKILQDMSKDILALVEEDDMFSVTAPLLHGDRFEKKMKDHMDTGRCLRNVSGTREKAHSPFEPRFCKSHPHGPRVLPLWGQQLYMYVPKERRPPLPPRKRELDKQVVQFQALFLETS